MIEQMITGILLGCSFVYVILQFEVPLTEYRRWIDLGLLGILIWVIILVPTNFVVGLTTFTGVTISLILRFVAWTQNRKK